MSVGRHVCGVDGQRGCGGVIKVGSEVDGLGKMVFSILEKTVTFWKVDG